MWPQLPYDTWKDTLDTLHLFTQIVGKIKLKQNTFLNQWWEVVLFVNSRGLTTGRIPYKNISFDVEFNFLVHKVVITTSTGKEAQLTLEPMTVALFYKKFMKMLKDLGITISINTLPSEIENAIDFEKDTIHKSYDKKYVEKWHGILLKTSFAMDKFRSTFRGKSSPVQFFWGSFDLNTTRFSGKKLANKSDWPKGYKFMRLAENEENFACGFWPGSEKFPHPAFYSYLYPSPKGCENMKIGPLSYFDKKLSECILLYEDVQKSKNPEKEILNFFEITYSEYARLAGWNTKELKISF